MPASELSIVKCETAGSSGSQSCFAGVATFCIIAPVALVTCLFTSFFTSCGPWMYKSLARPSEDWNVEFIHRKMFAIGSALLFVVYLLDMWRWQTCSRLFSAICILAMFAFLLGLCFLSPKFPGIPLILSCVVSMILIRLLREIAFKRIDGTSYMRGVSRALIVIAAMLAGSWLGWLVAPTGDQGYKEAAWGDSIDVALEGGDALLSGKAAFVLFYSPAFLALAYAVMAAFTWLQGSVRAEDALSHDCKYHRQLKSILAALFFLAFSVWMAASLAAVDIEVSKVVLRLSGACFICIFLYLANWIGISKVIEIASQNSTMAMVTGFFLSDWAKGGMVLLGLPFLPLYFAVAVARQCCRRRLRSCGILAEADEEQKEAEEADEEEEMEGKEEEEEEAMGEEGNECQCLTREAARVWEHCKAANHASVLTKSMYWGIGIYVMQVGVSLGLVIFLSWFNEVMASYHLLTLLEVLFVVEIALFLFPPVAGPPLYMIAAIGVVPKVGMDRFWLGIAISTLFCWFLKLCAVCLEQKAIGSVFSTSVGVKKFIGVQTPFMKGVRSILNEPGMTRGKVAVLIGGPDWPTSVTTGIMDLPLLPMLAGSLPVVVIIFPCCVSAAFLLKAGSQTIEGHRNQLKAIANIMLLVAGLCSGSANMMAAYFVQATVATHREELDHPDSDWQRDPQQAEVLAAVQKDAEFSEAYDEVTRWEVQPCFVKVILVLGSLSATATVYILINPVAKAFQKFSLTDKVSELPCGNVLEVIHPAGYASLGAFAITCGLLALHDLWCRWVTRGLGISSESSSTEETSLIERSGRED